MASKVSKVKGRRPLKPRDLPRRSIRFLVVGLLSSCAPHLQAPDTTVKTTTYLPGQPVTPAPMPAAWWTLFNNPSLNSLETQGLAANPSIGAAQQTLRAAQDAATAANGAYLPQILLGGASQPLATRAAYPAGPNSSPAYTIISPTGTITYDFGLFGTRHYTYENGAAQAAYQNAELDAARQTVTGNIATAAITYAGTQAQIDTTNAMIGAEQHLLTLLQGEFTAGAIPRLTLLQQQSLIQTTEATLPPLQAALTQAQDRLAILTGQLPGDFTAPPLTLDALTMPARLPVVLPSTYLANRPDLRAARATVAAQNASLGLAVAKLYPDISIAATGGLAAETLGTLFEPSAGLWSLAGNLLAPLYEGGTLHAQKDEAQAQLASALYAYKEAVLSAFGQAADALAAVQNDQAALARATEAAQTANDAYQLASAQYRLGAADYTTVLTAETTAAQAALTVTQARTNLALDIVRLESTMAP